MSNTSQSPSPLASAIIEQLKLIRLDRLDLFAPNDQKLIASIIDGENKRLNGPIEGTLHQLVNHIPPFWRA